MNFIDFEGHRSKMKVMKGIIDKCGVCRDATLCVVIFDNCLMWCLLYIWFD